MRRLVPYFGFVLLASLSLLAGISINRFQLKPIYSSVELIAQVEKNDTASNQFFDDLNAHLLELGYRPINCPSLQLQYDETFIHGTAGRSYWFRKEGDDMSDVYLRLNQFGRPLYEFQLCIVSIAGKKVDHATPLWNSTGLRNDLNAWAPNHGATLGDF